MWFLSSKTRDFISGDSDISGGLLWLQSHKVLAGAAEPRPHVAAGLETCSFWSNWSECWELRSFHTNQFSFYFTVLKAMPAICLSAAKKSWHAYLSDENAWQTFIHFSMSISRQTCGYITHTHTHKKYMYINLNISNWLSREFSLSDLCFVQSGVWHSPGTEQTFGQLTIHRTRDVSSQTMSGA